MYFNFNWLFTYFRQICFRSFTFSNELNAERESLNISEQELKISMSLYLPSVTLSGSKSSEDTSKLTNQNGSNASITDVNPSVQSITITQTLIDFGRGAEYEKSKKSSNTKIMSKEDVLSFMQTYQRVTQNMFRYMPKYASIIINLNSNHQIKSAVYKDK